MAPHIHHPTWGSLVTLGIVCKTDPIFNQTFSEGTPIRDALHVVFKWATNDDWNHNATLLMTWCGKACPI